MNAKISLVKGHELNSVYERGEAVGASQTPRSDEAVGWSRAAQDAAESLTLAVDQKLAAKPFLKRRMGYSTTGAFLVTILLLSMIVTVLLVLDALVGPIFVSFS
jgi:hypothetical protein